MIKTCKICGREFEADTNKRKLCSAECRAVNKRKSSHDYYCGFGGYSGYARTKCILRSRQKNIKFCQICGKPLVRHGNVNERIHPYRTHEKCLVYSALDKLKSNERIPKPDYQRLGRRGWNIADLREIMDDYMSGNLDDSLFGSD